MEAFVTAGAEYDAGGDVPRRGGPLVDPISLLQGSHEPGTYHRRGAVDPDQAPRQGAAYHLVHRAHSPRDPVGLVDLPRRALPLFRQPSVRQEPVLSAPLRSGRHAEYDPIFMCAPVVASSEPSTAKC
jgi:hypothetical protein